MPMKSALPRSVRSTAMSLLIVAAAACKSTTDTPVPARLTIVQGALQQAAVGSALPTPIVLRVTGTDGAPVPQIPVSLTVTAGGGTVDPASAISDANGEVKAKWTLGPLTVAQALSASVPGLEPISVPAVGILPSDIVIAQGNNQSAKASAALPVQLILRVTGGNNVPMPNQTVAFTIASGGGSISPASAVTNALGEVTVRWTLGPVVGAQTATATAGTVGPVTINATAN
jgi:hypothetical protein